MQHDYNMLQVCAHFVSGINGRRLVHQSIYLQA